MKLFQWIELNILVFKLTILTIKSMFSEQKCFYKKKWVVKDLYKSQELRLQDETNVGKS